MRIILKEHGLLGLGKVLVAGAFIDEDLSGSIKCGTCFNLLINNDFSGSS